jgi:hypothetical protein
MVGIIRTIIANLKKVTRASVARMQCNETREARHIKTPDSAALLPDYRLISLKKSAKRSSIDKVLGNLSIPFNIQPLR